MYQRGDWCVATILLEFEDQLLQNKQEIVIKKIMEASSRLSLLLNEENVMIIPIDSESDTGDLPCGSQNKELSVSYHRLLQNIHEDTLQGIWNKARSLVNDTTLVVPVPGSSSTSYHRMVASTTGNTPHLVSTPTKFTGQFKCDTQCPMYATYKLCSHTIAVAKISGKLDEFVNWIIKQKSVPNLTNLSMIGMPKGAGQKGGVPKHTRKQKKSDATQPKKTIDRLSDYADGETNPKALSNIAYTTACHGQQVNLQGQGAPLWSCGTVSVNNPLTFHNDTTHMYYPMPGVKTW